MTGLQVNFRKVQSISAEKFSSVEGPYICANYTPQAMLAGLPTNEIIDISIRKLLIGLDSDYIWIGGFESENFRLKITDVLFGPVDFHTDKIESFVCCHDQGAI